MTVNLRPYQTTLRDGVYRSWQEGHRATLAVLPTGGGKSVIISDIAGNNYRQGYTQAIIAHRNELVGQLAGHMARQGIKHRIIASAKSVSQITNEQRSEFGRSFVNPDSTCAVVSVDTLLARTEMLKHWLPQVRQWTIDECHHVIRNNKWGKAVQLFPNAYGLGVTATPRRADGMGLGAHADGVFSDMIIGPSMRELIAMGNLCDYEVVCPESDLIVDDNDFADSGELSPKKGREASKKSHIVGDVVKEYCKFALFKRAICFATDVETAGEIAEKFNQNHITAASISAETPAEVRAEMIRRFRAGKIHVLVNVDLFGEGFDVPAVEVVIMARPTGSLAVYLQQFGRALRPLEGKSHGLIIDHVSNFKRHGYPDKQHLWSLDRREKRAKKVIDPEEIPITVCRACTRPYERFMQVCPHCGAMPPLPDPVDRTPLHVDGDLTLLDRATLAAMRASIELESPASIAERVAMAAGEIAGRGAANRQIERIQTQQKLNETIAAWAGVGKAKGRSDAEMQRRFYLATGVDAITALTLPRADMDKLIETVEGWMNV